MFQGASRSTVGCTQHQPFLGQHTRIIPVKSMKNEQKNDKNQRTSTFMQTCRHRNIELILISILYELLALILLFCEPQTPRDGTSTPKKKNSCLVSSQKIILHPLLPQDSKYQLPISQDIPSNDRARRHRHSPI